MEAGPGKNRRVGFRAVALYPTYDNKLFDKIGGQIY